MTKDVKLVHCVIKHLLRFWPVASVEKVLVFLSALKDAVMFLPMIEAMETVFVKELMLRLRGCMGRRVSVACAKT
jgi:hypothetical protein